MDDLTTRELEPAPEGSIFHRLAGLIPDAAYIAKSLKISHIKAERVRRWMLETHAGLVDMAEIASQNLTGSDKGTAVATAVLVESAALADKNVEASAKAISAQESQIAANFVDMEAMAKFTDENAGARMVVENVKKVYATYDPATIADLMLGFNKPDVTLAGKRYMKPSEITEMINALQDALRDTPREWAEARKGMG